MNDKFINEFAEILEIDPSNITHNYNFKSLEGWDSLAALGLIALVDKHFNVQLSSQNIIDVNSVQDILNLINNK